MFETELSWHLRIIAGAFERYVTRENETIVKVVP